MSLISPHNMANIRFVKPPPDNRIRNFPYTPKQTENSLTTSGNTGLDSGTTLHITTPKRRKNHLPHWDIFITLRSETDTTMNTKSVSSTPVMSFELEQDKIHQIKPMPNQTQTDVLPANKQATHKAIQIFPEPHENVDGTGLKNSKKTMPSSNTISQVKSESDLKISDLNMQSKTGQISERRVSDSDELIPMSPRSTSPPADAPSPTATRRWVSQQKQASDHNKSNAMSIRPRLSSPNENTALTRVCVGLSEVSEEEVASLPDVDGPTTSLASTDTQLREQQDHCCQENTGEQYRNHPGSSQQRHKNFDKNPHSNRIGQRSLDQSKLSLIGLPRRPYPMGPLRRSISEYDFNYDNPMDYEDEEDVSFFSRIRNANHNKPKQPNLQDTKADSLDKSTGQENTFAQRNVPKYAWTERTVKDTAFFGGSDLVLSCNDRFALKSGRDSDSSPVSNPGSGQVSRTLTPIMPFAASSDSMSRSSRDTVHSARLAMRRFALADPERMIISQELREKLERDVQRRKSSTVRKVSQFFNIQLGLNKEEDLI